MKKGAENLAKHETSGLAGGRAARGDISGTPGSDFELETSVGGVSAIDRLNCVGARDGGPPRRVEKVGCPGLPIRLLVGLHYLKYLYDVSDEGVVEGFLENPYWQYFCGYEYFQSAAADFRAIQRARRGGWRCRVPRDSEQWISEGTWATISRRKRVEI